MSRGFFNNVNSPQELVRQLNEIACREMKDGRWEASINCTWISPAEAKAIRVRVLKITHKLREMRNEIDISMYLEECDETRRKYIVGNPGLARFFADDLTYAERRKILKELEAAIQLIDGFLADFRKILLATEETLGHKGWILKLRMYGAYRPIYQRGDGTKTCSISEAKQFRDLGTAIDWSRRMSAKSKDIYEAVMFEDEPNEF